MSDSSTSFTLEVDMSPIVAMAQRCKAPMEEPGNLIAEKLRQGARSQFSAGATFDGASVSSWPQPKPFGDEPSHAPMVKSGTLRAAWDGGTGSVTEIEASGVWIGVSKPDYVAPFQRDAPSVWDSGYSLAQRPVGISQSTLEEVVLVELQYINGPDPLEPD